MKTIEALHREPSSIPTISKGTSTEDAEGFKNAERILQERIEELSAITRLSRKIVSSLHLDEVIAMAQNEIHTTVIPDFTVVYLLEGNELLFRGSHPESRHHAEKGAKQVGQCLCGLVAQTGEPAYATDIHTDARCTLQECKDAGIRSFAALPLKVSGDVLGVLGLASFTERDFSERGEFLETLVGQISIAVQNARLYEQVSLYSEQLKARVAECLIAQEALRGETSFRAAVIERAAEGLCVGHALSEFPFIRFTVWNRRMEEITGYTIEEINRLGWYQSIYPDPEVQANAKARIDRIRQGEDLRDEELVITRADGEERVLRISTSYLKTGDGLLHVLALMHDVTERKRAEEALQRAYGELELRVMERTAALLQTTEALRESEKELRFLSSKLLSVREEEKASLSKEIHDTIGQSLIATKMGLESMLTLKGSGRSPRMAKTVESLLPIVQEMIERVRRLYMGLRPTVLDDFGVISAIGLLCRECMGTYSTINIINETDLQEEEIPKSLQVVIFRIVQESLSNIVRHSRAKNVIIALSSESDELRLVVQDDGMGFDVEGMRRLEKEKRGLGLASMKELASSFSGLLTIDSAPGRGTVLRASWPLSINITKE